MWSRSGRPSKNAVFILEMMQKRSIEKVQLLTASTAGVPSIVNGEVMVPGATQTLIFYAHYDGQPVNPPQWAKGIAPFDPKLFTAALNENGVNIPFSTDGTNYNNEWRIYSRSASDDKAGVDAILNAYSAMKKSILQPTVNLKFFLKEKKRQVLPI